MSEVVSLVNAGGAVTLTQQHSLVLATVSVLSAYAGPGSANAIEARVRELHARSSEVKVTLLDNTELQGRILRFEADSFTIRDKSGGKQRSNTPKRKTSQRAACHVARRCPLRHPNTNTHPENGSSASLSWQSRASESMPFLPSTGSIATSTRICGVIWIRPASPTAPG